MRTCSKMVVQKDRFLSGRLYPWWKGRIAPCLRDGKAVAVTPASYLATALTEIRDEPDMEQRGEEGPQPDDEKRGPVEELGGTGLVWSRNKKHRGTPVLGMRARNWFPCPLPPGKAEINIIYHSGEYAGYQNTWDWLGDGGIVFFDGQTCHGWSFLPDQIMGKGAWWLPRGSSSSCSSPSLPLYESI